MRPDYVIIGHLSRDRSGQETTIGGTAAYSARAARLLGWQVGVLTSAPDDVSVIPELDGTEVLSIPSDAWTSFEHTYDAGGRRQSWLSTAGEIQLEDVPLKWQTAQVLHLAPIAQELSPNFALGCPAGLCCATIQGWLRGRSSSSSVLVEVNPDLMRALRYLDACVVSVEDVQSDPVLIEELTSHTRILALTRGGSGCDVFIGGVKHSIGTEPLEPDDPTGAGDIFAAAFFSSLARTGDPIESARYANRFAGWILADRSRLDLHPDACDFDASRQSASQPVAE